MSANPFSGAAKVAGVVGRPITHSLSPLLHNSWIAALGLDAIYIPLSPAEATFAGFVEGLRGGTIRGLNVTLPFKEAALAAADEASPVAKAAGAANLLLFHEDGRIEARNADGEGLFYAFARQAPHLDLCAAPVVVLGAGGAAKGAVAALHERGVCDIRIVNRTRARAEALAQSFISASAWDFDDLRAAFDGAGAIINATSAEVSGGMGLALDFAWAPNEAVVMDMLYRPLKTSFLSKAQARGLHIVDGLDMLIGQGFPSFEAFFGVKPPSSVDPRAILLEAIGTG